MITTVTAYPSRYVNEPDTWEREALEKENQLLWARQSVGTFYLRFELMGKRIKQRALAALLGETLERKPEYHRRERYYTIDDWTVINANRITTGLFELESIDSVERVITVLKEMGFCPDGEITIYFRPERYDIPLMLNICTIMEARNELIVQALGLKEPLRIIDDEDLAFGVVLDAFDFEKIEACVSLMQQAGRMAAATRKARMQPCDMSNPKYQMRTWLLRLGFIGEPFARPRNTLLRNLEGNGAFFDDAGKEKANRKRRAARMAG